ncbi:MAG TPA: site-specific integrase [Novimethylophilus sp.]|jgi:integrase|uniref:site-specific integrase n=1 Tax=Novimethylophilus sp. TaxID=2137426 RepID=UPI002F3E381F
MATIRKKGDFQWHVQIRRKGYPNQTRTFMYREDAEKWARAAERDMDVGTFTSAADAERTTLRDLIKDFKVEFAPHHYRVRDDEKEAWRFQLARLDDALGDYSLAALDQKLIASYRDGRIKGNKDRSAVSESTVRKELYMLSKVLGFAQTEKGIVLPRGNPVERIRKPSDGKGRERRLTAEEWQAFESECRASRNPWLWPAVQLAVETAMRQGELLSLTWAQVNIKRKLAMLTDPEKIKNEEPRAVPLSSTALEVFKALPRAVSGVVLPVERLTLYHAFRYACDRAKVKNFTFHDLRHEALSRLAERGDFTVLELAAVSGHKTLQMLKRYTHLQAEKLAQKLG